MNYVFHELLSGLKKETTYPGWNPRINPVSSHLILPRRYAVAELLLQRVPCVRLSVEQWWYQIYVHFSPLILHSHTKPQKHRPRIGIVVSGWWMGCPWGGLDGWKVATDEAKPSTS